MHKKAYDINQQDALIALLGAGLGTAGGYGLYRLLTPAKNQTLTGGAGSALLGGLGGGGLGFAGSKWYSSVGDAMHLEALKKQQEAIAKVQAKQKDFNAARQGP